MNIYKMLITFLLIPSLMMAIPKFVDIDASSPELISMREMRFCYISFVKVDGKVFLIKQKIPLNKLLGVVRDALTAHIIADSSRENIAHKVEIIPAGKDFPGKKRSDWPATIHTVAPGHMIKAQESEYKKMNIKQAELGFRRDMLPWMAKHTTLATIVGYDTFLCNHDRHRGNLFYDKKNDSFCAIDMDSAFKYNLCDLACKNLMKMIQTGSLSFKSVEMKALMIYRDTLKYLIKKYKPEDTIALYDHFVEKAGFVEGSPLYTRKIRLELERNRAMMRESYADAQRLVEILNSIIRRVVKI